MLQTTSHAQILPSTTEVGSLPHLGVDDATLCRLGPGAYVHAFEWESLFSEARLRTRMTAARKRARGSTPVASHTTAAACHELPLYRVRSDRVEITVPGAHSRKNSRDVVRHHCPLPPDDVVLIDGHPVTSLSRTVFDVIRTTSLETAVVCFDAALRQVAWREETLTYDRRAAEEFRESIAARIRKATGARGIRQARFVCGIGDGRAQLPGESISRLWMMQLGIPEPQLQVRVEADERVFFLDFAWPRLGRWAEFDGASKYTDPAYAQGRSVDEILEDQRLREDAVIARTGWRVDRWGFDELSSFTAFAAHLRSIRLL